MTQDILELAKECGLACDIMKIVEQLQSQLSDALREIEHLKCNAVIDGTTIRLLEDELTELREVVRKAGEQTNYLGHITDQELDEQLRERYTKQGRADMHRDACNHVRSRNCATGHADTIEELLLHFEEQIIERLTIEGLK